MIASKAEIKSLAFGNNFDVAAIKDNVIMLVEYEQVLTLLGADLYDDIVATPLSYTTLLSNFLKPYIAWNVKVYISQGNHLKTGNKGAQIATGGNEVAGDVELAKREAMTWARKYKAQIIKYLDDNNVALWEGYEENDSIINKIIIL